MSRQDRPPQLEVAVCDLKLGPLSSPTGPVESVLANAGTAAAALDPKLRSFLREGEQLDGMEQIQLTLVRWIEDDHQRLEEHETAQRAELRQLKQLRVRRDEARTTLYSRLLRIRSTFEDAFGQGTASVYLGLDPGLGEVESQAFKRLARETVDILANPGLETPKAVVDGLWQSPELYAEQIRESLEPFQEALDAIETQKREVEKAQMARTELLERLNERLKWSIRLFEAVYQLAGLGFHAERLRVTFAARPSSGEEAAAGDGDSAEPDDGEATATAPAEEPFSTTP